MRVALLLAGLVACAPGGDDYPNTGGGGGGTHTGGGGAKDAADGDGPDGGIFAGTVCVRTDLRAAGTCASPIAGLTVTLGESSGTTDATGAFSFARPEGTNLVWHVRGSGVVTTVMRFGTSTVVPVVTSATYTELMADNGAGLFDQSAGSLVANVRAAGVPAVGATASVSPPAQYGPFYDGPTATAWQQQMTGAAGAVWFVGVPAGTSTLTVTASGGAQATFTEPVEALAITFATELL